MQWMDEVNITMRHPLGPLSQTWISNYTHNIVWDDIAYQFSNFNGATVDVWEWISNFIPYISGYMINYPHWD